MNLHRTRRSGLIKQVYTVRFQNILQVKRKLHIPLTLGIFKPRKPLEVNRPGNMKYVGKKS